MRRRLLCEALLLSLILLHAQAQFLRFVDEIPGVIKDSATVVEDWKLLEKLMQTLVNKGTKTLMSLVMENMQDVNISSTCIRDAVYLFGGIRKLQTWAFRFVDSSAKSIDGVITGSIASYGAYDECIDSVALDQRSGRHKGEVMFTGKYCIVRIKPSLPRKKKSYKLDHVMEEFKGIYKKETILGKAMTYAQFLHYVSVRLGVCIPSGCSVDDVNQMLSKVAKYTHLHVKVKRCEVKEDITFTPMMIFVICVYSFAGFLVLLGTVIDLFSFYTGRTLNRKSLRLFLIFSLVSNFRKLVDTSTSSKHLSCLNGIRFATMAWVVLVHSNLMLMYEVINGLESIRTFANDFAIQVILNGTPAVETFFFLSGLLVCYVVTNQVKFNNREFSVTLYIIHRLFRILPAYSFSILAIFLMDSMVSGPMAYTMIEPFIGGCRKNWWTNLLFINNFYNADDMCMPHGWFLSVDMQFHIGALIIILPLLKWPKVGTGIAVVGIISSIASCGIVTYVRSFPPAPVISDADVEKLYSFLVDFHIKPYPHGSPYIMGILVGYLLSTKPKFKIPRVILWCGWSVSIICAMSAAYGTYGWNGGREYTQWEAILFGSFQRMAWIVGVSWMVVCCATGHGGVVNYILSWKMWIPVGKLSFMAYLLHPIVIAVFCAGVKNTISPTHSMCVWIFLGNLMVTYGVAFAASIMIESPLIALEKILFARGVDERLKKLERNTDIEVDSREAVNKKDMTSNGNSHAKDPPRDILSCNEFENSGFDSRL